MSEASIAANLHEAFDIKTYRLVQLAFNFISRIHALTNVADFLLG
jgi:hypothetical protein